MRKLSQIRPEKNYTLDELAEISGYKVDTLRGFIRTGQLAGRQRVKGGKWLVPESAYREFSKNLVVSENRKFDDEIQENPGESRRITAGKSNHQKATKK